MGSNPLGLINCDVSKFSRSSGTLIQCFGKCLQYDRRKALEIVNESKTGQWVGAVKPSGCRMAKECGMLESESWKL